jgi:hypothetical protein
LPTRIDINQFAIIHNRDLLGDPHAAADQYQKPVIIRGAESQCVNGAVLEGTIEVFYERDSDPQIFIVVTGTIDTTYQTRENPREDKTGGTSYIYVHQAARVPAPAERAKRRSRKDAARLYQRLACPCPAIIKRSADTPVWGHRVRITGKCDIVYSRTQTLRGRGKEGVRLWIETQSDQVECIKEPDQCCCSGKDETLWPGFCPYVVTLPPMRRRRTLA